MNTHHLKAIIVMAVLALTALNIKAQVSMGSLNEPQKGVLLELKTKEANNPVLVTDAENETVDANGGGLLFPRVKLTDKSTLEPFVDSKGQSAVTYAGMVVYNLTVSDDFQLGLYVWNGSEWSKVSEGSDAGKERYFLIPSFNIELKAKGEPNDVNLYEEYLKQYDLKHNSLLVSSNSALTSPSGRIYGANELDYVVTYYDSDVIEDVHVSAAGHLTFTTKSLDLTPNSFLNVMAVVK
jgi:hypothetical protein